MESDSDYEYVSGDSDSDEDLCISNSTRVDSTRSRKFSTIIDTELTSVTTPVRSHTEKSVATVVDPFNGNELPRGILYGRRIREVPASFFSPFERKRFFQIVWSPSEEGDKENNGYDTTWCTYEELKEYMGSYFSGLNDEDGRQVENYCFKSPDEFMLYRRIQFDFFHEGDDNAMYVFHGRCNALIWTESSKVYDQRCRNSCSVPKSSPNYVPYCVHHHHAMHDPSSMDRKRFYRGQWCGLVLM